MFLETGVRNDRLTRLVRLAVREVAKAPANAKFGLVVVFIYTSCALFAEWIAPYGQAQIVSQPFRPWSTEFLLGTDNLGRDTFSRLIYGGRNTIALALSATVLAFLLGGVGGMLSTISGKWVEQLLSRVVDVLMALPILIFALLLLSVFGSSATNLVGIISVLESTRVFRVVRAASAYVAEMDYVEAAELRGEGKIWIMSREILPNIMAPVLAEFGVRFCFVLLLISAISFLGLGIQPPAADWGAMVRENAILINFGNPLPLLPAIAIALLTISVNYLVDWFLQRSSGLKE